MKIALTQLNYCIGNFEQNTKKIVEAALKAKSEGADLVVFSELSVCGYFPFDCLEFDDFLEHCQSAVDEIAEKCFDVPVIVGAPIRNVTEGQKTLFNAAIFLHQGQRKVLGKSTLAAIRCLTNASISNPTMRKMNCWSCVVIVLLFSLATT